MCACSWCSRFVKGAPAYVNDLPRLEQFDAYWVDGGAANVATLNPNPALFGNRCHMQVALDCEPAAAIQNSATEETLVELVPRSVLPELLRRGAIDHALVVAALYAYELWRSRASSASDI